MELKLTVDGDMLRKAEELLKAIPGEAPKAVARAINRTLVGARQEVVSAVAGSYTISSNDVRESISLRPANPSSLRAAVVSRGPVMGAQHFQHKNIPKTGVHIRVRKDGRGGITPGAFLMPSKIGIFRAEKVKRIMQSGPRKGKLARPIKRLFSPAVPSMMKMKLADVEFLDRLSARLERELLHEIDYRLMKGAR